MDRPNERRQQKSSGPIGCLYVLAAPAYLIRSVAALLRLLRIWRLSRYGYVECPHCRTVNALDVLGKCPKCQTTEFGNRLRCGGCGTVVTAFLCEACGVAIRIF